MKACKVIEASEIGEAIWNDLVKKSLVANWFQTPEAYRLFASFSFVEVFGMAVVNGGNLKGVIVGYVQKDGGRFMRFFSRRAIILGGPLLSANISDEELTMLLNEVKRKLRRKAIYVETRNFNDYNKWQPVLNRCGFKYEPHYDIIVDTCSLETVVENMGKSRKRDIRVSQRDGASIIVNPTIEQVNSYYLILSDLYKYRIKTPLFPLEFFHKLYQAADSVFLLVEYKGEIIGGTVCVGLQGKTLYEMYACGENGGYKHIFPSELATFAGLHYSATNDFLHFDMMGAGKPDDGGYGVRDFKLKFGGDLMEFGRNIFICNPLLYNIGKFGISIIKRI